MLVALKTLPAFLTLYNALPFLSITDEYPLALGKAVSKKNREVLQTQLQSLVYGETEFTTLGNVFEKIKTVYGRPNQVSRNLRTVFNFDLTELFGTEQLCEPDTEYDFLLYLSTDLECWTIKEHSYENIPLF